MDVFFALTSDLAGKIEKGRMKKRGVDFSFLIADRIHQKGVGHYICAMEFFLASPYLKPLVRIRLEMG